MLGVLNVSPESGPSDSLAIIEKDIIYRVKFLLENGASYIDVGARSTSKRDSKLSDKEEYERLLPTIELLKKNGYKISVDTWSIENALKCMELGVDMINFTGGDYNEEFFEGIKNNNVWLIMTYMPYGNPYVMDTMDMIPFSINHILAYFTCKINEAKRHDVNKIIIDPNTGIFHKDLNKIKKIEIQHEIINNIGRFKILDYPIMVFVPRGKDLDSKKRISAMVLKNKYEYIRTHDPHVITELLDIFQE